MKKLAAPPMLMACLAAILIATAMLGAVSYYVLSRVDHTFDVAVNSTARKLWLAGDINMAAGDMLAAQRGILLYGNTQEGKVNIDLFDTRSKQVDRDAAELGSLSANRGELKTIAIVRESNASYRAVVDNILKQQWITLIDSRAVADAYKSMDQVTAQLEVLESDHLREALAETHTTFKYGRIGMGLFVAIALLVVLFALRTVGGIGIELRASEEEAHDAHLFLKKIMDCIPGVVCIFDMEGNLKRWNRNFLGYAREEMLNTRVMKVLDTDSRRGLERAIARAKREGQGETEAYLIARDGRKIPTYLTGVRFLYHGEPCILGVGLDISKQKKAEHFSRLQRVALESASEAIVITDESGSIEWANPAFTTLTGYELAEVLGMNPRILKSGMMNLDFYRSLWTTILKGEQWSGELWNLKKDGNVYCEEMHIAPVRAVNESISNFVAVKHDITERKQLEAQAGRAKQELVMMNRKLQEANENILRISQTDALTGLANRRTIDDRIVEEMARTERLGCGFSVILGDLDHFKSINDEFGHLIGDGVLKTVAKVLAQQARPYDLPARFGGEEFLVLLPESTLSDAMTIAQRIRSDIAGVASPKLGRPITMSLGISTWGHGDTAGDLIGRADAALYQAKRRGRNRVVARTSDKQVPARIALDGDTDAMLVRIA